MWKLRGTTRNLDYSDNILVPRNTKTYGLALISWCHVTTLQSFQCVMSWLPCTRSISICLIHFQPLEASPYHMYLKTGHIFSCEVANYMLRCLYHPRHHWCKSWIQHPPSCGRITTIWEMGYRYCRTHFNALKLKQVCHHGVSKLAVLHVKAEGGH